MLGHSFSVVLLCTFALWHGSEATSFRGLARQEPSDAVHLKVPESNAEGKCRQDDVNRVNEVLKIVNSGYPSECALLRNAPEELVPQIFCGDSVCKKWAIDTLNLKSCDNPGMDAWQKVVRKNLAACTRIVTTPRPEVAERQGSATATPVDVAPSTAKTEAPSDRHPPKEEEIPSGSGAGSLRSMLLESNERKPDAAPTTSGASRHLPHLMLPMVVFVSLLSIVY